MTSRKNQKNMSEIEWQVFINAINKIHIDKLPKSTYREFVEVHENAMKMSNMSWGVHTQIGHNMKGTNFLSWHRWFLLLLEKKLQTYNPNVFIPYWDSITNLDIPEPLASHNLPRNWNVARGVYDKSQIAKKNDLTSVNKNTVFKLFQSDLEVKVHGGLHNAVGGNMKTSSSPNDPLFWLHHAYIDKIWADWQITNNSNPENLDFILKPVSLFGIKVSEVQNIATLNYKYL